MGESEQCGHVLALGDGGLVLWNALNLKQGNRGVFGAALLGTRLSNLFHHLRKRAGQLEPRGPVLQLLAKGVTIDFTEFERLAVLAGVGAALVARIRGFELAIGAQELAFDETKVGEEV